MEADKEPKVLIVEDELLIRWFIRDVLESEGYSIEEAGSAKQAIGMLEDDGYEAVVTDVEMPGEMNGIDLAWAVEANWPQMGVVITSGRTLPSKQDIPPGARFLAKPVQVETLLQAVEEVIED